MIPLRLSLAGLYSYREAVEIDFQRLTAARLFGIFGPVGSGKSTILEAMTLALYGESARLNHQDRRSANMMNLQSDRLSVVFEFQNRRGRRFRFSAEAKRSTKDPRNAESFRRRAYRYDEGEDRWVPLESVDAEAVLGLSYQNFRRTTIIPQGRFQEFLQLGGTERTSMMKELFQLERFDLAQRVSRMHGRTAERRRSIEALQAELPPQLEDQIEALGQEHAKLEHERAELTETLAERRATLERLRLIRHRRDERLRRATEHRELAAQQEEIDALRGRVRLLERCRDELAPLHRELIAAREDGAAAQRRHKETQEALIPVRARYEAARAQLETLSALEARRPQREALRDALELRADRWTRQAEREELLREEKELAHRLAEDQEQEERYRRELAELEEGLPDRELLRGADRALERRRAASQRQQQRRERERALLADLGLDSRESLEAARRDTAEELRRREREQHAHTLAAALIDGEPCPVCGARHHPAPAEASHRADGGDLTKLRGRFEQLTAAAATCAAPDEQDARAEPSAVSAWLPEDLSAAEEAVNAAWKAVSRREEIQRAVTEIRSRRSASERRRGSVEALRAEADRELERVVAAEEKVCPILDEEHRSILETVDASDDSRRRARAIDEEMTALGSDLARLREEQQGVLAEIAALEAQQKERDYAVQHALSRHRSAEEAMGRVADVLDLNLEQAEELLEEVPQIGEYRRRTQEHHRQLRGLAERIEQLDGEIAEHSRRQDPAASEVEAEIATMEGRLRAVDGRSGAVQRQLVDLRTAKDRRDRLRREETELRTREANLGTLLNLFRGAGFVGFVARVFLEQLLAEANERFRRLTHNQLELVLEGERDFAVVDYLNGGRRRSVKTLSGGQTFQAALCLAIALADSIDSGAGAEAGPGFFFLDEGFGALDAEALQDVFTTLKDLRRENRIVGVISHVEELQQEIDTRLIISLEEERGSTIYEG